MSFPATSTSPAPGGDLRRSHTAVSFEDDGRPDETTAFLSRRLTSQNYHTLQNDTDAVPRARKSAYKRSTSTLRPDESVPTRGSEENEQNGSPPEMGEEEPKWWEKALSPFRSIELENTGSVARDHLALGTDPLTHNPFSFLFPFFFLPIPS